MRCCEIGEARREVGKVRREVGEVGLGNDPSKYK